VLRDTLGQRYGQILNIKIAGAQLVLQRHVGTSDDRKKATTANSGLALCGHFSKFGVRIFKQAFILPTNSSPKTRTAPSRKPLVAIKPNGT
jgi:hypothetical protein